MKAKSKQKRAKPQQDDGNPSPLGFATLIGVTLPSGRIHLDLEYDEWVALAVDRVLGRFPTREQAERAVREASQRKRRAAADVDVIEDDDWEDER